MTDDSEAPLWPPEMLQMFTEKGEQAVETQQEMFQRMLGASMSGGMDVGQLGAMTGTATFKTRVQSGGRISIPDAEREALDIEEGDIVQAVVFPVKRNREE